MKIVTTKLALALLGVSLVTSPAFAAPADGTAPKSGERHGNRRGQDPAKRVARMTKMLDLTAGQQTQITAILTNAKAQYDALRTGEKSPGNRQKARELREATNAKIEAILTAEQRTKWAALKDKMKNRMKEGYGRKAALEAPTTAA